LLFPKKESSSTPSTDRLCDAHGWPRKSLSQLAKRIVESEASVEDFALHRQRSYVSGGAYEPVKYTRLVEWLEENGVQYTPEAMAYLLQSMGTSTDEQQRLDAAVDVDTFVRAFREHETMPPLVIETDADDAAYDLSTAFSI
jgi:hypothetical protein